MTLLRGDTYDPSSELNSMKKQVEDSSLKKSSIFDLIRTTGVRKATLVSLAGMVFQQLSGVNAVIFYTSDIFKDAGSSMNPDLSSILVALVQVINNSVMIILLTK